MQPALDPVLTSSWPSLDLLLTYYGPIIDLLLTCPWSVSDLLVPFPWPACDLSMTCSWPSLDLFLTWLALDLLFYPLPFFSLQFGALISEQNMTLALISLCHPLRDITDILTIPPHQNRAKVQQMREQFCNVSFMDLEREYNVLQGKIMQVKFVFKKLHWASAILWKSRPS